MSTAVRQVQAMTADCSRVAGLLGPTMPTALSPKLVHVRLTRSIRVSADRSHLGGNRLVMRQQSSARYGRESVS